MALPTKQDLLSNLPLVSQPAEEKCFICLDAYESQLLYPQGGDLSDEASHRAVQTPCDHVFGESCLTMWLERKPTCPMCRRPLYEAEDDEEGEELEEDGEARLVVEQEIEPLRTELRDLRLDLEDDDADNRTTLALLFAFIKDATSVDAQDPEAIAQLKRGVTAINHGRLILWRNGMLHVDNSDFELHPLALVDKNSLTAEVERQEFAVQPEEIKKALVWYFERCLQEAMDDGRAGKVGMILHPCSMQLIDDAVEFLREVEGEMWTPRQIRSVVRDVLDARLAVDAPGGLEMMMMWDVTEIVAVALAGQRGTMFVDAEKGWESFGIEEREE